MRKNNKKVKPNKTKKVVPVDFYSKLFNTKDTERSSFQNNITRLTEFSPVYSGIKYI